MVACRPPTIITFRFDCTSSRVSRSPSTWVFTIDESRVSSGAAWSRSIVGASVSFTSSDARSAIACFSGSPSKFAAPVASSTNQRRSVSSGTSARPSARLSTRAESGSANSETSSAAPRSAKASTSPCASGAITASGYWPIAPTRNHG